MCASTQRWISSRLSRWVDLGRGWASSSLPISLMHRTFAAVALVTGCICLTAAAAGAHHSVVANFDQSKSVTVTGRIKELDMRNPHSQITLDVPPPAGGAAVEWFIEWSDVNSLIRRSVPYNQLKVGDEVTITVSPSRRFPNVATPPAVLPAARSADAARASAESARARPNRRGDRETWICGRRSGCGARVGCGAAGSVTRRPGRVWTGDSATSRISSCPAGERHAPIRLP